MAASKTKLKKAARLRHSGLSQAESLVKAGVLSTMETAKKNAWNYFHEEKGNAIILEELGKLQKIEFDEAVLSKKEKLEANARLSRGVLDKIEKSLGDEEAEIDHKLIDSYVKLGKRDDVLQGHQIMAETNPQDKRDAQVAEWYLEAQEENEKLRSQLEEKKADVIDVKTVNE